jgi:hypothetical protein
VLEFVDLGNVIPPLPHESTPPPPESNVRSIPFANATMSVCLLLMVRMEIVVV